MQYECIALGQVRALPGVQLLGTFFEQLDVERRFGVRVGDDGEGCAGEAEGGFE